MERLSDPQGKKSFIHRHFWRCVLLVGLFASMVTVIFVINSVVTIPAFSATLTPSRDTATSSPTRGPVGAVIVVSGSGGFLSDGTQVNFGYTADFRTCNVVSGDQTSVVQQGAFRGWFRWPAGTGTGHFGVCASVSNSFAFQVGNYQVLSNSAPRVSVTPTIPQADAKATVSGVDFLPGGTNVNLVWRSANGGESASLGTVSSDNTGAFTHTFTVPARSSTGSYTLTGTVGSGSPPTLSAQATFRVNGITIVAMPRPKLDPGSTATPTASATVTPHVVAIHRPAAPSSGDLASKTGMLLPIALAGTLLIALSLGAGVLVVHRQRNLVTPIIASSGLLPWSDATDMMVGSPPPGGAFLPWSGAMYPGGNSPVGNPGMEFSPLPESVTPLAVWNKTTIVPSGAWDKATMIPFDPGLVEAMREAQVSLFATPRPPANEKIEVL